MLGGTGRLNSPAVGKVERPVPTGGAITSLFKDDTKTLNITHSQSTKIVSLKLQM